MNSGRLVAARAKVANSMLAIRTFHACPAVRKTASSAVAVRMG